MAKIFQYLYFLFKLTFSKLILTITFNLLFLWFFFFFFLTKTAKREKSLLEALSCLLVPYLFPGGVCLNINSRKTTLGVGWESRVKYILFIQMIVYYVIDTCKPTSLFSANVHLIFLTELLTTFSSWQLWPTTDFTFKCSIQKYLAQGIW